MDSKLVQRILTTKTMKYVYVFMLAMQRGNQKHGYRLLVILPEVFLQFRYFHFNVGVVSLTFASHGKHFITLTLAYHRKLLFALT